MTFKRQTITIIVFFKLLSNVYSYPTRPGHQILNKFNLTLPPCKTIAIVGESGGGNVILQQFHVQKLMSKLNVNYHCIFISGKSTVASLLERFYDPTGGVIMLDGLDIRTLDLTWLRGQVIGFINQVEKEIDIFIKCIVSVLHLPHLCSCGSNN